MIENELVFLCYEKKNKTWYVKECVLNLLMIILSLNCWMLLTFLSARIINCSPPLSHLRLVLQFYCTINHVINFTLQPYFFGLYKPGKIVMDEDEAST